MNLIRPNRSLCSFLPILLSDETPIVLFQLNKARKQQVCHLRNRAAFDLEPPNFLRLLHCACGVREQGEQPFSLSGAAVLFSEYMRFLQMKLDGHADAQPSEAIDQVWHAHIMCTRAYHVRWRAITYWAGLHSFGVYHFLIAKF